MSDVKWKEATAGGTWNFEEDSELSGTLISIEANVGQNESMMYQIQDSNDEVHRVWGSTVLDDRMKQLELGDMVKIVYEGKEKNPTTGRTLKKYRVFYHREEVKKK